jgi:hypothetical protein
MGVARPYLVPLLVAAALAGCGQGGPPADLFVVERDGQEPGARLTLRFADDGGAYCNDGDRVDLTSDELLQARELRRVLDGNEREETVGLAEQGFARPPGPGSLVRFRVRSEKGTISFADTSRGLPKELLQLVVLVRTVAQDRCGLER